MSTMTTTAVPTPSPHARGSTGARLQRTDWLGRLPRTRGDQPSWSRVKGWQTSPSPHARGSTEHSQLAACKRTAFPARAGINRTRFHHVFASAGLPRTRGDQPGLCIESTEGHAAFPARAGINRPSFGRVRPRPQPSPHARGSTVDESRIRLRTERLPRTRGDQPIAFAQQYYRAHAFPARAGINRRSAGLDRLQHRLPRTRGDQPCMCHAGVDRPGPSPHARGSAESRGESRESPHAFPARAGINRTTTPKPYGCWKSCPHTRGSADPG